MTNCAIFGSKPPSDKSIEIIDSNISIDPPNYLENVATTERLAIDGASHQKVEYKVNTKSEVESDYYASELFSHKLALKVTWKDSNGDLFNGSGIDSNGKKITPKSDSKVCDSNGDLNNATRALVKEILGPPEILLACAPPEGSAPKHEMLGAQCVSKDPSCVTKKVNKFDKMNLDAKKADMVDEIEVDMAKDVKVKEVDGLAVNSDINGEVKFVKQRHLPTNLQTGVHTNRTIECYKGEIHKNNHSTKIDSPGLKSAKQNVRGVQRRIKMFEKVAANDVAEVKVIVNRSEIKFSPNKIKSKRKSAEVDKMSSQCDKKPQVNDKIMSIDKIDKNNVFIKAVEGNDDVKGVSSNEDTETRGKNLKTDGVLDKKNAYDILMKSIKEGTPTTKPRKYQKKRLKAMTPKSLTQKSIRDWFKHE